MSTEIRQKMNLQSKFEVPWLDLTFFMALEDDTVGQIFGAVSDSLGPLVRGSYKGKTSQIALLKLLGPAFVCKHLRHVFIYY